MAASAARGPEGSNIIDLIRQAKTSAEIEKGISSLTARSTMTGGRRFSLGGTKEVSAEEIITALKAAERSNVELEPKVWTSLKGKYDEAGAKTTGIMQRVFDNTKEGSRISQHEREAYEKTVPRILAEIHNKWMDFDQARQEDLSSPSPEEEEDNGDLSIYTPIGLSANPETEKKVNREYFEFVLRNVPLNDKEFLSQAKEELLELYPESSELIEEVFSQDNITRLQNQPRWDIL